MIGLNCRLMAVPLLALTIFTAFAQRVPSKVDSEITVTARRYEFSPNAIKVKKGDHIRLLITTLDRDHGVKLKAFHIDENLPTGEAVTVEVTADLVGAFPFECSRFCGLGHKHMRGHLIVE